MAETRIGSPPWRTRLESTPASSSNLSGWGRYPMLDCRMERLRERGDLRGLLDRGCALIARGNGRSYGDAALNPDLTLSMLAMDRRPIHPRLGEAETPQDGSGAMMQTDVRGTKQ